MQQLEPTSYIVQCNGRDRHVHLDHLRGTPDQRLPDPIPAIPVPDTRPLRHRPPASSELDMAPAPIEPPVDLPAVPAVYPVPAVYSRPSRE